MLSVFQYWHVPEPCLEVSQLIATWVSDKAITHRLYSHDSASAFIKSRFGPDEVDCWNQCRVPAMQADFFRLCALFEYGGAYVDCDTENLGGLPVLCDSADRGVLFMRHGNVANDFMYFAQPRDRLAAYALEQAKRNIRSKASNSVWRVTGPGIMTHLRNEEPTKWAGLSRGIQLMDVTEVRTIVGFRWDLEYKSGGEHWTNYKGSIFEMPR